MTDALATILEIFPLLSFSIRRRHTRFDCDWSSDVCSSDLNRLRLRISSIHLLPATYRVGLWLAAPVQAQSVTGAYDYVESALEIEVLARSEERRVGKECRVR